MGNYNLVGLGNSEWLLVFRGREEEKRMNLGRSDSREQLTEWANTLCRYLRELNRQCEAVYVVEKSLFTPAEPFTVLLAFTGWTARTHSPRFREECTRLARSVIPAHLKMETCWLGALQMQVAREHKGECPGGHPCQIPEEDDGCPLDGFHPGTQRRGKRPGRRNST